MDRRSLLFAAAAAAMAPVSRDAEAQAEETVPSDYLSTLLSGDDRVNRMLLAVDAVRLLVALAVTEGGDVLRQLEAGQESYLAMREQVRAIAVEAAKMILARGSEGLQLSDDVARVVVKVETTLVESGIDRTSKLGRELFDSFRAFAKIGETAAHDAFLNWLCSDYPLKYFCG